MSETLLPEAATVVEKQDFRNAMARLAAAVNIITTDGPAGCAGFTASAVCSVTDSPPMLLVCLNRSASVYDVFNANRQLCVNTLAAGQETLSGLFGGKTPMTERFNAAEWSVLTTGSPVLAGAIASFDCHVTQITRAGTHDVLFCEVKALLCNEEAHGLMWFDRHYHPLLRQE
ncbi:NADH-dependent FMN reductase RutF [Erwinia sp. BNK-24-b]|uniref:NADH-dependent FMN reductase RutF n=1 Tax=Erwinia TaxID=551 RepID=UPI001FEF933E|nr:pyrimidine utilization flavin reductase protein F [Erwinia phyllosphaerae]MBV4369202.1 pyrimidine utilization flavin reductase protein F [Erwinia phyllosphaerae]